MFSTWVFPAMMVLLAGCSSKAPEQQPTSADTTAPSAAAQPNDEPDSTAGATQDASQSKSGETADTSTPASEPQSTEPQPPGTAGEVKLVDTSPEGFQKLLASKKGKVVLVDFWATWCVPCRKNFPHIVEFHEQYSPQGLDVISISLDDAEAREAAVDFLKENRATFDNLISTLGIDSFEPFGITGGSIPHYRLYDRNGKLVKTFETDPTAEKPITAGDIEPEIQKLLAEQ